MKKTIKLKLSNEKPPLFTADWHYGHANVIKWPPRNAYFSSIEEHNEKLVKNFCDIVEDQKVFILGDMFLRTKNEEIHDVLKNLPGQKYLILGNHNEWYTWREYRKYFVDVSEHLHLRIFPESGKTSIDIFLCHYAMRTYNKSHYGAINLHGHSHGKLHIGPYLQLKDDKLSPVLYQAVDVGVDCWNYAPVTLKQVLWQVSKQNLAMWKALKKF